jgi:hypothetical protein
MAIFDILYDRWDTINEVTTGLLNEPLDILFNYYLREDFVEELSLGTLNSPLDITMGRYEYDRLQQEYIYVPPPIPPLYAPLDILTGKDNEDLLEESLKVKRDVAY